MAHGGQGVVHGSRVGATALCDVVATATPPAPGLRSDAYEVTRCQSPLATAVAHRSHDHRPSVADRRHSDDCRPVTESATNIERELAQVVSGGAVGRAVRHNRDTELLGCRACNLAG